MKQSYRLQVLIQIQQLEEGRPYMGPGLEVRETADVEAGDFLELAGMLGEFHTLTEAMKAKHAAGK